MNEDQDQNQKIGVTEKTKHHARVQYRKPNPC